MTSTTYAPCAQAEPTATPSSPSPSMDELQLLVRDLIPWTYVHQIVGKALSRPAAVRRGLSGTFPPSIVIGDRRHWRRADIVRWAADHGIDTGRGRRREVAQHVCAPQACRSG